MQSITKEELTSNKKYSADTQYKTKIDKKADTQRKIEAIEQDIKDKLEDSFYSHD